MEIRNIITFLRVAELESFTKAANQLGYSQAAVTVQIKNLEEELGTPLFDRIGKQIKLTENGHRFTAYAANILKATEDAKSFIEKKEAPSGKLCIGSISSLSWGILPPIFLEFRELCPSVKINLLVSDYASDLFNMMKQNDIDLLFFLDSPKGSPDWIMEAERPEPLVFVAHSTNPIVHEKKVSLKRILQEPFILAARGVSYSHDMEQMLSERNYDSHYSMVDGYGLDTLLSSHNLKVEPFFQTGATDVITKMLLNKAGVSFLPQFLIQDYIDSGELAIIDADCQETNLKSRLFRHKNKWITPQMQIFIDLMKKHVKL